MADWRNEKNKIKKMKGCFMTGEICCSGDESSVRFAAEELRNYYAEICGKILDISNTGVKAEFILGTVAKMAGNIPDDFSEILPEIKFDGFCIGTVDGITYIVAEKPRGVLNGVYYMLEESAGVVFAGPGREYVPRDANFKADETIRVVNPDLEFRGIGFHNAWSHQDNWKEIIDYMAKRRYNLVQSFIGAYEDRRDDLLEIINSRGIILDIGAHSAFNLLAPEEYLESHPEFFSRAADGSIIAKHLCYSNKNMREVLTEKCVEFLNRHPEVAILGLWPQDGGGRCECPECQKTGMARCVAETVCFIAEKIAKTHPHVLLNHLAYSVYTKAPEGMSFPGNVLINHCDYWDRIRNHPVYDYTYGCLYLRSKEDIAEARKAGRYFRMHRDICEEIKAWQQACGHVMEFTYHTDLNIVKVIANTVKTIRDDMKYYKAINLSGFVDCNCYVYLWESMALNIYALGRLGWDSSTEPDAILADFAKAHFSPVVAKIMTKFYKTLEEIMCRPSILGFNNMDLLHRDAREVGNMAGIDARLIDVALDDFMAGINGLHGIIKEAESVCPEISGRLFDLRVCVQELEDTFRIQFCVYAVHALKKQSKNHGAVCDKLLAMAVAAADHYGKTIGPTGKQRAKLAAMRERSIAEARSV